MARSRIVNVSNLEQFTAINVLSDPGHIGGPVVVPNCVQIVLNWTQASGKLAHNVLYGRSAGVPSPTPAQADAIFSALNSGAAYTALKALFAPSSSFAGVSLRSVHTANNPIVSSTGAAVVGTAPGAQFPNEVAAVITLRTAATGQQNRGRMFIPNWTVDSITTGNIIAATSVTALQNWANTISAAISAGGYTWVIGQPARAAYTGSTGTQHPARVATSIPVTAATVRDNHWDSQRRRGLK